MVRIAKATVVEEKPWRETALDAAQFGLDLAGLIPGYGEIGDVIYDKRI